MLGRATLICFFYSVLAALPREEFSDTHSNLLERTVTPNNTCGPSNNGYTCDPKASLGGPCCSKNGYCGSSSAYCGAGCQWGYSNPGCSYSKSNTCGPANGFTCKPNSSLGGPCCSSQGYCGYTSLYCGTGCQSSYGTCFGTSPPAVQSGGMYIVGGVGSFTNYESFTFPTDGVFPSGLLKSSGYIGDPPNHQFVPGNVNVQGGYLQLLVPGGQSSSPPPQCAQVTSKAKFLHASVRTYAMFSDVPGTCQASFFYRSDSQEIDIEYLTDPNSRSNPGNGSQPLQFTNQATDGNPADETHAEVPSPADRTTAVHEYRTDWIHGKSMFYLDGVLQKTFTTNVPTKPGPWIWNNWCGNFNFTAGPPAADNTFLIQRIEMYYNSTN